LHSEQEEIEMETVAVRVKDLKHNVAIDREICRSLEETAQDNSFVTKLVRIITRRSGSAG
jgi:hypothetical protein